MSLFEAKCQGFTAYFPDYLSKTSHFVRAWQSCVIKVTVP